MCVTFLKPASCANASISSGVKRVAKGVPDAAAPFCAHSLRPTRLGLRRGRRVLLDFMTHEPTVVLVVGARPTGLFVALLLATLGVRVRIVDAAAERLKRGDPCVACGIGPQGAEVEYRARFVAGR